MKRFGSILTFLISVVFVALFSYVTVVVFMLYMQSSEASAYLKEILGYMTPSAYVMSITLVWSGALLFFTCLFAFIGIFTKKGGIVATSRCALIGLIISVISLAAGLIATFITKDIMVLCRYLAELMQNEQVNAESISYVLNIMVAAFVGYNLIVFLFSLITKPRKKGKRKKKALQENKRKKEVLQEVEKGKKAGQDMRSYSVDPSEREVYSEEDRLNMAAYGSLVSGATPRTTTRSGYYTVNNYSGSSYSYGKKQKHKKGRCTDAELFNRFNKVLVSNGYIDSLGGRGGFPF